MTVQFFFQYNNGIYDIIHLVRFILTRFNLSITKFGVAKFNLQGRHLAGFDLVFTLEGD